MEQSSSIPTTLYEFPNGYNINLTIEKFKLTEGLFNASNLTGISGGDLLSIPNIVLNSASMCDADIKPVGVAFYLLLFKSFTMLSIPYLVGFFSGYLFHKVYVMLFFSFFSEFVLESGCGGWEFTSSRVSRSPE